jgi:hypothetical protein
MNIDLLPFSAFALESYGAPAPARGELHTLTLALALAAVHSSHDEAMSGSVSTNQAFTGATSLRAAVLPADGTPLTITF